MKKGAQPHGGSGAPPTHQLNPNRPYGTPYPCWSTPYYVERVAFDLIVNFERMLGRRIPPAPLADWLDYVALDGGLLPAEGEAQTADNEIRVYFIHRPETAQLQNFTPAHFADEINGKAFADRLGEFSLSALAVEPVVDHDDLIVEVFEQMLLDADADRVMLVADLDGFTPESTRLAARIKGLCAQPPKREDGTDAGRKEITLFTMQPLSGRGFAQELLGYSLTAALGIRADEVTRPVNRNAFLCEGAKKAP